MRLLTLTAITLVAAAPLTAQDLPESSADAIAAHVEGLRAYLAADYAAAQPHFLRAHELDPTFLVPVFMAALNAGNAGMGSAADSLWGVLEENRDRFSDYYRRLIDIYLLRRSGGDLFESVDMARSVAHDYPGTKASYNFALWSNQLGRPIQALEALATLDPDKGPMKGWVGYFDVKCTALHYVGDIEEETRCAREAIRRFPDRISAHWYLARAHAAGGRTKELVSATERMLLRDEVRGWNHGGSVGSIGLELLARGHDDATAAEYMTRAIDWIRALPEDQANTAAARRGLAFWTYASGDFAEAYRMYAAIVEDFGSPTDRARKAITAALAGDGGTAVEIREAFLAGSVQPTRRPQQHYWAALISVALDDLPAAEEHFQETWAGAESHTEPVLFMKMRGHPALEAFLRPRG